MKKPGFQCKNCNRWVGDLHYQASITVLDASHNICFCCFASLEDRQFTELLDDVLHRAFDLSKRNHKILTLKMAGLTQRQIARRVGISRGRVSQILSRFYDQLIDEYLPLPPGGRVVHLCT